MILIQSYPAAELAVAIKTLKVNTGELACWWLGQAGFILKSENTCCIIDPYLSDSLAVKYREAKFKHQRMTPIPVAPKELTGLDGILCTHHHSDHLDPGTLPALLEANPAARLIAPRASFDRLEAMGLGTALSDPVNPQMKLSVGNFTITVIPACHETMETDRAGNYRFVGYLLEAANIRIYHSGDCIPFDSQAKLLRSLNTDLALLPINGRDEIRSSNGIPGNFTVDEAIELCNEADIEGLICHHFEMFDFNTIDREIARQTLKQHAQSLQWLLPELETTYIIKPENLSIGVNHGKYHKTA